MTTAKYDVATKTVNDLWENYLKNRPHVDHAYVEDVIKECQPLTDPSRLPRPLTDGAVAYEHPNIKTHIFVVKEPQDSDERIFVGMIPSRSQNARVTPIPMIGDEPVDVTERADFYREKMKEIDDWLASNRDAADRDKVILVKNRLLEKYKECKVELPDDATRPFRNSHGKLQYDAAFVYLLNKVEELNSRLANMESK